MYYAFSITSLLRLQAVFRENRSKVTLMTQLRRSSTVRYSCVDRLLGPQIKLNRLEVLQEIIFPLGSQSPDFLDLVYLQFIYYLICSKRSIVLSQPKFLPRL